MPGAETLIVSSTMRQPVPCRDKSGTAILEVWARYFPEEYTDGSGNQITEDSYDYAVLKAETGMSNRKASYVTLKERVNTHWKIIQFPIPCQVWSDSGNAC